jgi:tetratricopeptide (TPR) repeat protein
MIQEKLIQLMKKYGMKAFVYVYSPQIQEDGKLSSKIRFGQAKHLERRGKIEYAIELFKQAANFFPPSGFKYLKNAAELAEKNHLYKQAFLLYLETICFTPDFCLKLSCLRNAIKSLILYELNRS